MIAPASQRSVNNEVIPMIAPASQRSVGDKRLTDSRRVRLIDRY